jgi:hypothetical protein
VKRQEVVEFFEETEESGVSHGRQLAKNVF